MPEFKGGCLCGAIRYEVAAKPVNMWNCHCTDCQKSSGASYATNVFVKVADLTITKGEPDRFQHQADSGNTMTKEYCSNCGSQLFNGNSGRPAIKVIRAGTIDDPSFVVPRANIYASRALPAAIEGTEIPTFDEMPPDPSVFFRS
ncbi:GFA family protein [Roseibium sp.]|uniref:GFA family protein n=1 Tax=Roseibium sp. TaxID=1936156 RepID=UPI003BAA3074